MYSKTIFAEIYFNFFSYTLFSHTLQSLTRNKFSDCNNDVRTKKFLSFVLDFQIRLEQLTSMLHNIRMQNVENLSCSGDFFRDFERHESYISYKLL